jgi:anti-sigma factor RsiW
MTTMHELDGRMTDDERERLRDLRATTMLRLTGNRIHREYVDGTLDTATRETVEKAIGDLSRLDAEIAHHRSARVVATSVGRLADALDADDHLIGQQEVASGGSMMAAMAILSGWEVGRLDPF